MIEKLKTLHKLYKQERYKEKTWHLADPQTGISATERERLLSFPEFKEGKVDFFGKTFYFSHGPSFVHSVDEIFGGELYRFFCDTKQPYIIDCGANIGVSIHYFKKLYPGATIIAFEPDGQMFNLLKTNIADLENVTIEKKAVWTENTTLEFYAEGALAGSLVTDFGKKNQKITVEAIDFRSYLNRKVDFLKIDIEGAENELIFHLRGHLSNVKHLFLEYHGLLGQPQNLGDILNLLNEEGFQYYIRLAGETIDYPFCGEKPATFNQQLNILCYRN